MRLCDNAVATCGGKRSRSASAGTKMPPPPMPADMASAPVTRNTTPASASSGVRLGSSGLCCWHGPPGATRPAHISLYPSMVASVARCEAGRVTAAPPQSSPVAFEPAHAAGAQCSRR
eukprot:3484108-Prymnesium_polylepis.1